ncbi:MAG: DUF1453 family protein [Candidatus Eremiobacteraeota bacterium]|nr:DUF1453 family protein [Candidatus Eremiobacteraeota bacterium]MBV8355831.1 DUF1453 family protein [Candidatus Eremiobacteraeota bacterium]
MTKAELTQVIVYLIVIALVIVRLARPQRMRASRLWIAPAIVLALTALVVWASFEARVSAPAIALAVVVGAVLGYPFGLLRGRHTDVRTTENPKVLLVQPSVIPMLIWGSAFLVRFAVRAFLPHAGTIALEASDGFLAFAVASVIAARVVIAQKFRELHAA